VHDNGSIDFRTIDMNGLQRLNQMILAMPPNDSGSSADVAANGQVDLIPRKGLADSDFDLIANGIASNSIDP
jgi:hypothetical protein